MSGQMATADSGLTWSEIYYDIPLDKAKRKAAQAAARDAEKGQSPVLGTEPKGRSLSNDAPQLQAGSRRIINGVSGHVAQGEYVGILGASGAGKTTLLNILSARLSKTGDLSGNVLYQGKPRDPPTWKRTIGYVEQDDAMLPRLTVRETIQYSAKLRLPDELFSKEEKSQRVEEVIEMLRLEGCEGTRIGGERERGVSGGERKRTSIGVELVSDVSLLFLDEPTSGLDAFAADLLVRNVAEVVKTRNIACLMTIHQPSWNVFCRLDRVILLAKGGVFYDGPPRATIPWFASLGYEVPEGTNPADHFISIAENAEKNDEGEKRVQRLLDAWAERVRTGAGASDDTLRSDAAAGADSQVAANAGGGEKNMMASTAGHRGMSEEEQRARGQREAKRQEDRKQIRTGWPTPWWREFYLLFTRAALEISRDKATLIGSIGQTFILLILIGFAFFRLGSSQADILAKVGVLFFIPINASFAVLFPLITPFAVQRRILIRERSSGLYRTSSFFLAKLALEVPNAVVSRTIYYVVLYFMIGLKLNASAFFTFMGINFLHLTNAVGLGLAIGAVSPTIDIANIIAPLINVIFLLFGGSFLPTPPPWFIWLRYISPIFYTYSALAQNEFLGETFDCQGASTQCYQTGQQVLSSYNLGRFTIGQNAGFLGAITLAFITAGYLGLRWSARPRFRFIKQ